MGSLEWIMPTQQRSLTDIDIINKSVVTRPVECVCSLMVVRR